MIIEIDSQLAFIDTAPPLKGKPTMFATLGGGEREERTSTSHLGYNHP
jgi:hypothetical protein